MRRNEMRERESERARERNVDRSAVGSSDRKTK